jgi:ribosomal protein RSM22 (predicted rRNA methylase)
MCTKDAKLEEVIFTASKHGKEMYRCARASKWGDLVPVALETALEEDTSEDKTNLKTEQE